MNKKFLLSFAALLGIFTGAMADDYGLKICGIDVTDENKGDLIAVVNSQKSESDPVATGTMTYNSETKTLSMKDVSIDVSGYQVIDLTKDVVIEQTGSNCIRANSFIIFPNGSPNITFKGNGTLTLMCTENWGSPFWMNRSFGDEEATVTIDHTTLICGSEAENCYPFYGSHKVNLVINESTVKSAGGIQYWKSITLTNARISEPSGAYLKENWAEVFVDGELAKNVVIVPDTRKKVELNWDMPSGWYGEVTVLFGEELTNMPTLSNPNNVAVTYESSNPSVATVDAQGNITILKSGVVPDDENADLRHSDGYHIKYVYIKAIFAGNEEYLPEVTTYKLAIFKGRTSVVINYPETWTGKAVLGEDFIEPTVTVKNSKQETLDLTVSYESSNTSVATVNAATGEITAVGVGETTIKVKTMGDDNYSATENNYTIRVIERGVTTLSFEKETYGAPAGGTFTAPTLNNPDNVTVSYTSSNTAVATVDANTGAVTIVGVGETTITAESEKTDEFEAASASYLLKVNKITPSVVFAKAEFEATIGESFESPLAITTPEGLTVTYSSSDETVATVDATTGVVTLLKAGTTEITAAVAADDIYNAASGKYTLSVSASTGIGQVDAAAASAEVYDLLGRRVQGVTNRGLYIVNGHKVICK